ncbi:unnamed protein product [Ixodes pacificus]
MPLIDPKARAFPHLLFVILYARKMRICGSWFCNCSLPPSIPHAE